MEDLDANIKKELLSSFQNSGAIDNIKSQLRMHLLKKLKGKVPGISKEEKQVLERQMLQRKIICSLINDYFQKENFMYTYSVFVPETGFADNFLTSSQLEQLLHFKNISDTSYLETIVEEIMNEPLKFYKRTKEVSLQTEECEYGLTLDQKLSRIDFHYSSTKYNKNQPSKELEERMVKYKKEMDVKMKAEIAAEISRIRNTELSSIKLEEAAKCRIKMQECRNELEQLYNDKLQKLKKKEQDILQQCRQKEKEVEKMEYEHRQIMVKDMDSLEAREHDVKREVEVRSKELEQEKNKLKKLQAEYKAKLANLERDRSRFNEEVNKKFRE